MLTQDVFKKKVFELADMVGVKPKEIHIRRMNRKRASCSSKGRLTFDVSLLDENKEVRYKIILHELLHLRYRNHSKMFHLLLRAYLNKSLNATETAE